MIRQALRVYVQVCESGSFNKAAARLYVTPSAVMQQMDSLEKEYAVKLLRRTHQGVQPTEAGAYLLEEAKEMLRRSAEIRSRLDHIAADSSSICIGTSLLEKCRLLYDLWALYSQKNPACRIEMVSIGSKSHIPEHTDLIESLNSGIDWMRKYQFLEICRVPIGIAMERTHPLAKKSALDPTDLCGLQVSTFRGTAYEGLDELHRLLEDIGAQSVWEDMPSPSVFWKCAFDHRLLLAPLCWSDILPGLTIRPVRWNFSLPYGIFSRVSPRDEVARFLRFVRDVYAGNNPYDVVPALNYW